MSTPQMRSPIDQMISSPNKVPPPTEARLDRQTSSRSRRQHDDNSSPYSYVTKYVMYISSFLPSCRPLEQGQRRELQGPSLGGIAATGSDTRPRGGREQRSTQHWAGRTSRYVVVVVVGFARSRCSPWHLMPGREVRI